MISITFYSTATNAQPGTTVSRNDPECTGNGGTITPAAAGDRCEFTPDTQKITFFRLELCTEEPTGPTTSAIADRSKCVTFFRNDSGSEVSIKKRLGTQIGKAQHYSAVPYATYTHGLVTMGSTFKFKSSVTFDGDVADTDSNDTGSTCVTKIPAGGASTIIYGFHNNLNHANSNVDCTDGATAAEIIIGVNTMTMDNSNNCYHLKKFVTSGPLIDAYLLQSNGQLHGSVNGSDVVANDTDGCKSGVSNGVTNIQGVMPFTIPIIISPQTIGLQIKYNNTQGLKLDMASDNVFYKFDSSFFDFTLTALTGRTRGSFR